MIRYASIFLLAVMLTQILGKGFVWLNYQLNKEYISQNLCEKKKANCEGKCHLKKQLDRTESDSEVVDFLKLKLEVFLPTSLPAFSICIILSGILSGIVGIPPYPAWLSSQAIRAIFHPPSLS